MSHAGATTFEASFRNGLGISLEGAFVVGGSLEIQSVTESAISLPGGITHVAKQQAVFKIQMFGYEGTWGWERSVAVDPMVFFNGPMMETAWARLREQPWTTHPGGSYTGNIPEKAKLKIGGTLIFGGSIGASVNLLQRK
jgi:hypothetical protein